MPTLKSGSSTSPLALTAGEPGGIGPDLCLAIAASRAADVIVITDPAVLEARAERLGVQAGLDVLDPADAEWPAAVAGRLRVVPIEMAAPLVCGALDRRNAPALIQSLRLAVDGCLDGRFSGLVTAPLQKSIINDAGIPFTGHTEFLAELTATPLPVMLLTGGDLRVALASTHLPLAAVPAYLTRERLASILSVLHHDLRRRFRLTDPEIVVLGLNPHAGEGGYLGHEEDEVIRPVIESLTAEGMTLRGPLPADTAFTPAGGHADAYLAMYHDQGLPVLKYASFGKAVNVTLGLPIVRTSVDHGTALDLAGTGTAESASLEAAIDLARRLAR